MAVETVFLDENHNFAPPGRARYFVRTETDADGRVIDEAWVRLEPSPDVDQIKRIYLAFSSGRGRVAWLAGAGAALQLGALIIATTTGTGTTIAVLLGFAGATLAATAIVRLLR